MTYPMKLSLEIPLYTINLVDNDQVQVHSLET